MDHPVISPKKLIEVALPLDAINAAAAREKSIRHGHPSTLHLWWARRPLAAARAVIFSQLVNDPEDLWRCQNPGKEPNAQVKGHWTKTRARLFSIIEELVKWENTTNEIVLEKAREEIRRSWLESCELNKHHPQALDLFNPNKMPGLHDPFAGGGTIPLEAQRLGLDAYASDLNPVAVLINKAMIEIPPKFSGLAPVNRPSREKYGMGTKQWHRAEGLAEDVWHYGEWMREQAFTKIGNLYPQIEITPEMSLERPDLKPYIGKKLNVIAWLWARTVKSPNPAFSNVAVPLASTFILGGKAGKEAYVQPVIEKGNYSFTVKVGKPPSGSKTGTKVGRGGNFRCLMSNSPISVQSIRDSGTAGLLGERLMAIVADGAPGRIYLSPTEEHEALAHSASPGWRPDLPIAHNPRDIRCQLYGLRTYGDLFTKRQLLALTTFSDLIDEVRQRVYKDAIASSMGDDEISLDRGGTGARAYAEAVSVILAFAIDKTTDRNSSLCGWDSSRDSIRGVFGRQALPIVWDFAESNALEESAGSYSNAIDQCVRVLKELPCGGAGTVVQYNASMQTMSQGRFVSTDPPYYDNIGYADLSDFFYVWLRRSLRSIFPELLATIAVPKADELVATPYRHGTKEKAEHFFMEGMTHAMRKLAEQSHPAAPITIYYAFKQSDTEGDGTNSSGWESFLEAVNRSGLTLTGTWPMRTELGNRMIGAGTNALASSIVLVCRPRAIDAGTLSRRQFIRELNTALPLALDAMTRESEGLASPVAPVDLSQAIIGPGMAIFSKYSSVLEADGAPMTIRTALQLINRFLAEDDFDADTQFCLHWFEGHGWDQGIFGEADVLARAKSTSVNGLVDAGVLRSGSGRVQLLRPSEFNADWNPDKDNRIPIWEILHQLIRALRNGGESEAGQLLSHLTVQSRAEAARQLSYRLYTLCERKGWADDARAYNELVTSWAAIESNASREPDVKQGELF